MKKKTLMIISIAAVMVLAVGGILAYLTDTASVTNVFTVGNVEIALDEADVDEDGNLLKDDGTVTDKIDEAARTEEGNEYHLVPGMEYIKDPTITVVKGSEKSYVRMMMVIENAGAVDALIAADDKNGDKGTVVDYADLFEGWAEDKWIYEDFEKDDVNDTITFEFRYFETVDASEATEDVKLPALFDKLVVPGFATVDLLKELAAPTDGSDPFKMTVYGHAIQAAGFEDTTDDAGNVTLAIDNAWAAFEAEVK